MSDRWTARLSEYLDDDLAERERRELEAHLESCPACRVALDELRLVLAEARKLEPSAPPTDLWPGIAARMGERRPARSAPAWREWRMSLSLPQAAAAAAALVVISVGISWMVGRAPWLVTRGPSENGGRPFAVGTRPAAPSPAPPSAGDAPGGAASSASSAAFVDPRYDAMIAELQRILDEERSRLDPNTVKVLEKNLKIIDGAVADARRAVEADPSSLYLREHLARVMKQKMSLLRQATMIAGQQG
jgi:hypothetical protein